MRCDSGFGQARRIGVAEPGLGAAFDEVLIDCPPTVGEQTLDILTAGDLLLIPTAIPADAAWPALFAGGPPPPLTWTLLKELSPHRRALFSADT